eukprot:SAG31_NODE_28349_length_411_cov_1.000000_1_plen_126_part_10
MAEEPEPEPEPESEPPGARDAVERISGALQMGIVAMKSGPWWTFDADSGGTDAPRNPYMARPLPYVVGTAEYHDDEACGLDYEDEDLDAMGGDESDSDLSSDFSDSEDSMLSDGEESLSESDLSSD